MISNRSTIHRSILVSAYFGFKFFPDKTNPNKDSSSFHPCTYRECCNEDYISPRLSALKDDFDNHLFGQHIAVEVILPALQSHFRNIQTSAKPLVMSFHGTPGTGKNYVSDRIVKHLYAKGEESKYVNRFRGRMDFPVAEHVPIYRVSCLQRSFSKLLHHS